MKMRIISLLFLPMLTTCITFDKSIHESQSTDDLCSSYVNRYTTEGNEKIIAEILKERGVKKCFAFNETKLVPYSAEELRLEEELRTKKLKLKEEREAKELKRMALLNKGIAKASRPFICKGKNQCKKAFTLTQVYISENAEMKIQLATDTIIETYGSSDNIAMKATKMPGKDNSESIYLIVTSPYAYPEKRKLELLKGFHQFINSNL